MNDDRETQGLCEEQHEQGGAGAVRISAIASHQAQPVPPPPSAPGEFLDSQWIDSLASGKSHRKVGEPLAPPPPSAPEEFLCAQWLDGVLPEFQPEARDVAIFRDAVPDSIGSSSQLADLSESSGNQDEPLPLIKAEDPESSYDGVAVRLREVPLARDEEISLVFLPDEGLVEAVPRSGQALILTSHRIIAFRGVEGFRDTHMALASEISQCSVRTGQRNWGAILQGLMIMVGGGFLYLIVGYWLAGQVSGPNVPVLNIDVAPLIALLIVLAGLFVLASNYFTRPAGALIFHGLGVEIAFPFRSSLRLGQVYDFVDRVHSVRWHRSAHRPGSGSPDGEDGG